MIIPHSVQFDMQLDGVDVFVKVVQFGGFSAAARQLGMPMSTVSAKVARLEERLGTTLIHRSTRRMHVTPAGEAYYRRCVEAVSLLETGESELAAARVAPSGTLRLTAAPDMAQTLIAPILARYLAAYPSVSVDMLVTNRVIDLIAEGVDLAVRASPYLKDSTLVARRFTMGRLVLAASSAYLDRHGRPQTFADLAFSEILVHTRFPAEVQVFSPDGTAYELRPSSRVRADDLQSLAALAAQGGGIVLIPDIGAAQTGLEPGLPGYATPAPPAPFVYPASRQMAPNVRAFIDLATEIMA